MAFDLRKCLIFLILLVRRVRGCERPGATRCRSLCQCVPKSKITTVGPGDLTGAGARERAPHSSRGVSLAVPASAVSPGHPPWVPNQSCSDCPEPASLELVQFQVMGGLPERVVGVS
jgi:hypothetical protein